MKSRVYPRDKNTEKYEEKVKKFKKNILSNIEENLNDYQLFKIKHNNEFEFILVKKNSIHYNVLKTSIKVNDAITLL